MGLWFLGYRSEMQMTKQASYVSSSRAGRADVVEVLLDDGVRPEVDATEPSLVTASGHVGAAPLVRPSNPRQGHHSASVISL